MTNVSRSKCSQPPAATHRLTHSVCRPRTRAVPRKNDDIYKETLCARIILLEVVAISEEPSRLSPDMCLPPSLVVSRRRPASPSACRVFSRPPSFLPFSNREKQCSSPNTRRVEKEQQKVVNRGKVRESSKGGTVHGEFTQLDSAPCHRSRTVGRAHDKSLNRKVRFSLLLQKRIAAKKKSLLGNEERTCLSTCQPQL